MNEICYTIDDSSKRTYFTDLENNHDIVKDIITDEFFSSVFDGPKNIIIYDKENDNSQKYLVDIFYSDNVLTTISIADNNND